MRARITFLFILISIFSFCQSFEQKVAEKTCKCISEIKPITKEEFRKCESESFGSTLNETDDKKIKRKIKNIKGMIEVIKNINAILIDTCPGKKEEETRESS